MQTYADIIIISHIARNDTGWRIQDNDTHQKNVSKLACLFSDAFGMKKFGAVLGQIHDKGKEKKSFQEHILRESGFDTSITVTGDPTHAYVGALVARQIYPLFHQLLSPEIAGHHRGLYDDSELEGVLEKEMPSDINLDIPIEDITRQDIIHLTKKDYHHLVRMLFSCLTDADYLDTEAFMYPNMSKLRSQVCGLDSLMPTLDTYLSTLSRHSEDTPLNKIRADIQTLCRSSARCEKGFYSLTVPTGGGKTLASLLWSMVHAQKWGMKRIVIAIPYTSIVVQTASILKKIFGEENVLEHHSGFDIESIKDPSMRERARMASENWNCPIIVTTNVRLFKSMMSNKPSDCRKLHNLVNSVIILDEVQTLPMDYLQPIVDTLKTYNSLFGTSVLFTTASQPVLSGLIEGCNTRASFSGIERITEIIPIEMKLHERLKRVNIEDITSPMDYDELANRLKGHPRVLCIVNTRNDAREIFSRLPKEGIRVHLSRMMCPAHLRETIEYVKNSLSEGGNEIIRVVSTQLIEAGVDIDFPVVYRQESGLDSILQAAGRCNREGRLDNATAYVFSLSKVRPLPHGEMQEANNARLALGANLDWFSPEIMTEYFRQLYSRKVTFDKKDMKGYLYKPGDISFETASNEFNLIEDAGTSVIVNWKNSDKIVRKLESSGPNYKIMKDLSGYSVNIGKRCFESMSKAGLIKEVIEGVYYVQDKAQYDEMTGLNTENHWDNETLIV